MCKGRKLKVTVSWDSNCLATWPCYMALSTGESCVPARCWCCSCPVFLLCPLHGQTPGALGHPADSPLLPFPQYPAWFFCSCPTFSCSYRHCGLFLQEHPWYYIFPSPGIPCITSFLASTQVAFALGLYLPLHTLRCSLRRWCLWVKGPLKILHAEVGGASWLLIALFRQLFKKHLLPGPVQNTALPFCM